MVKPEGSAHQESFPALYSIWHCSSHLLTCFAFCTEMNFLVSLWEKKEIQTIRNIYPRISRISMKFEVVEEIVSENLSQNNLNAEVILEFCSVSGPTF